MERKVEWTEAVLLEMREIFEFYDERNGTSKYSESLFRQIIVSINRIAINPLLGHMTEYPHVRYVVVIPNYSVFYYYVAYSWDFLKAVLLPRIDAFVFDCQLFA